MCMHIEQSAKQKSKVHSYIGHKDIKKERIYMYIKHMYMCVSFGIAVDPRRMLLSIFIRVGYEEYGWRA